MIDFNSVGQGRQYDEVIKADEAKTGTYKEIVENLPTDGPRLPFGSMPKAPDPSPFVLGPMSPGGRE